MFRFNSLSLKFIAVLCINVVTLYADDNPQKGSLVILEDRIQNKIPEGINLLQKVQFLTSLVKEQAERMQALRDEVQSLKNKLHLMHLTAFSEERGNHKQLYAALKKESSQNKEMRSQLENIILSLKEENEGEKRKNQEAEIHITSLMTALESQVIALEKIEAKYKEELSKLIYPNDEPVNYKQLYTELEDELTQYAETHNQLDKLLQQTQVEFESEKQKNNDAGIYITALWAALEEQKTSLESLEENHKNQFQQLSSTSAEADKYKTLYASMEQELAQNQDAQNQLEHLVKQLKQKSEEEKQRIDEAENYIQSLMANLKEKSESVESIQRNHKDALEKFNTVSDEVHNQKQLNESLNQELAQTKELHEQMNLLIQQLKEENQAEKQKIADAETQINILTEALETQNLSAQEMLTNNQEQMELLASAAEDGKKYQILSLFLENELAKSHETQNQLELLIQQLKMKNEQDQQTISETELQISSLIGALDLQNLDLQQKEESFKAELNYKNNKDRQILAEQQTLASAYEEEIKEYRGILSQLQEDLIHQEKILAAQNDDLTDMSQKLRSCSSDSQSYTQNLYEGWQTEYALSEISKNKHCQHADTLTAHLLILKNQKDKLKAAFMEERAKAEKLQRDCNEVQQIYNEIAKHHNDLYADHHLVQTQFRNLQNELEDRKIDYRTALLHQKKVIEEQAKILQQVQLDKQSLTAQLHAIPLTLEEINFLHENHEKLKKEWERLKASHEEILSELEKYKTNLEEENDLETASSKSEEFEHL